MAAPSAVRIVMDLLEAAPGLAALVGERVFAEIAPQGATLPYIVLRQSGGRQDYTLGGPGGVREARVVAQAFAKTFTVADQVAGAMDDAFRAGFAHSSGDRAVTILLDGVNLSDHVDALKAFRRAIEVRLMIGP